MTPESNIRAAALLRDLKPRLVSDRHRSVAEEMARRFEETRNPAGGLAEPQLEGLCL